MNSILRLQAEKHDLLEVKYAKASDPKNHAQELLAEARTQLRQYATDPIVTQSIGTARLKLISVVFRTWEIVEMEEVMANDEE